MTCRKGSRDETDDASDNFHLRSNTHLSIELVFQTTRLNTKPVPKACARKFRIPEFNKIWERFSNKVTMRAMRWL